MASHESFGHMQHKLCMKERSGIDLTPVCAGGVQHTVTKLSRRVTSLL
jgi:hypothetical protein